MKEQLIPNRHLAVTLSSRSSSPAPKEWRDIELIAKFKPAKPARLLKYDNCNVCAWYTANTATGGWDKASTYLVVCEVV